MSSTGGGKNWQPMGTTNRIPGELPSTLGIPEKKQSRRSVGE